MNTKDKLINHIEMMIGDEDKVEVIMTVAAGIITKEDENGNPMVLLIQRAADDHWPLHFEFPRGKCDKPIGEKPRPCAIREIKEETGLDVVIDEFIGKFEYLADKGKRKSICYNYICKMKNPEQKVKLSHEHRTYKWITQMGEAEMMVHQDQKRFIEKILSVDNPIISTPENDFTKNNKLEEAKMLTDDYLKQLQEVAKPKKLNEIEAGELFGQWYIKLNSGEMAVAAIVAASAIIYMATKGIKKFKAPQECKDYKVGSIKFKICAEEGKNKEDMNTISFIKSKMNLCKNSKNPVKCSNKLKEKINKLKMKIQKRKAKMQSLKLRY